jgi:hypothetical protein
VGVITILLFQKRFLQRKTEEVPVGNTPVADDAERVM